MEQKPFAELRLNLRSRKTGNDSSTSDSRDVGDTICKKFKSNSGLALTKGQVVSQLADVEKDYRIEELIGEGGFGKVFKVIHIESETERAMKVFSKDASSESVLESMNELQLLKDLDHPNIIRIFEFAEAEDNYCVITEIVKGGSLFDRLTTQGAEPYNEGQIKQIMEQILMAINYAHSHQIVHRDIKTENILVEFDDDGDGEEEEQNNEGKVKQVRIKVIDWGLSTLIEKGTSLKVDCGTAHFKAPEVMLNDYNEKCDIWSCGTLMYELITGNPPFDGTTEKEIIDKIKLGEYTITDEVKESLSEEALAVMKAMLTYSKEDRPSAADVLKYPWFVKKESEILSNIEGMRKGMNRIRDFHANSFLLKFVLTFFAMHTMSTEENRELTCLFNAIDTDKNGKISKDEMAASLRLVHLNYMLYYHWQKSSLLHKQLYNTKDDQSQLSSSSSVTEEEISEIVSQLDFNGNGEIEYTEFLVGAMKKYTLQNDEFLHSIFDLFDSDGDGSISLSEIQQKLENTVENGSASQSSSAEQQSILKQDIWEQIMAEVDSNGDKLISFEEFRSIINTYFISNDIQLSQELFN